MWQIESAFSAHPRKLMMKLKTTFVPRLIWLLAAVAALSLLAGCANEQDKGSTRPVQVVTVTPLAADSGTSSPALALLPLPDARAIAYQPGGDLVALSSGHTVWLYTEALEPVRALKGHTQAVRGLAWSPDGTRLVSASLDHTLRVWEAASGKQVGILKGHADWVVTAAWSPDGSRLVSGGTDKTARIWDMATLTQVAVLDHAASLTAVAWSLSRKPRRLRTRTASRRSPGRERS
jgi:WD40 repeat protein